MNGVNGHYGQAAPSTWQEFRTPDGRVYYYNAATKATQWTKPEEMMTPAERALANQPWKEYTAEGGRKYWYHTETKQSVWEMPEAYKKALGQTGTPTTPATPSAGASAGGYGGSGYDSRDQRDVVPEARQLTFGDPRAQAFVPESNEPEYDSPEEAEAAFVKLLRQSKVQPDWTWEQTLRVIVKDPQYRAIKDPRERKAAFEKYCYEAIAQDKERAKERLTKLRADFATMLKSHPEIKHYTHWKTARPIIEGETIFRSTNNENERRQLFEDYVHELKKTHREQQAALHKSAMDGLIDLLPKLNLEPYTRWSEAQDLITATPPFKNDQKFQTLSRFDLLTVFQTHMKALERAFNDSRQEEKTKKLRKERQARDGFLSLLTELRRNHKIKAGTKWTQIYPSVENDDRYKAMLGQGGSTPQELFWDLVEEEERALRGTRNDVEDVIDDARFEVTPKTTIDDFLSVMKNDRRTANIDRDILTLIFERLQEKKKERRSDEDRQAERQQRRALDDLRSLMKRLEPPITVQDTYEKIKPRLAKTEEFQAVSSEDARQAAFDKYLRRLREKEEEADRDRHRRRERERDDRSYRERERGERSHRHGGRGRSRSPEQDSYEADRRKAIAERERNYRKTSMAESLLSDRRPSDSHYDAHRDRDRERERDRDRERERERDRDRDRDRLRERERERDRRDDRGDRYRDEDRPPRSRRDEGPGAYDRERRDREEERERLYRRRATTDRNADELNYGDDRPGSTSSSTRRRRGDDDDVDRRDTREHKRLRREYTPPAGGVPPRPPSPGGPRDSRERTPQRDREQRPRSRKTATPQPPPKVVEEDAAGVHSGSEEGEIEED